MIKEILIILACVPLYVINSFCDKHVSSMDGNRHVFLYNTVKFLTAALFSLPFMLADAAPKWMLGALLCGIGCGVMYAISKVLILKGYEETSVAFMTLCHAAGMILPCIVGHFLWSERLTFFAIIGILLTVVSIVLLKDAPQERRSRSKIGILLGLIIFATSGGVMLLQKCMGRYFIGESVAAYNFYSFFVAFLLLCPRIRRAKSDRSSYKHLLPCALGSALSLCIISLFMTSLSGRVPSVILFPLFNGLGIMLVCLGSIPVFHERMTKKKLLGLIGSVIGLCLINL